MAQQQQRGPGARKVELERRLDANADVERQALDGDARPRSRPSANDDRIEAAKDTPTPSQQHCGRGHKAELAQPHRSGRPSGGNIRHDREQ